MAEKEFIVTIQKIEQITHNVNRYITSKPPEYSFEPGQATEVAIHNEEWENEKRPFTFTNLPSDDHLEFTIKSYHDHDGVTHQMDQLKESDKLLIGEAWGAITYKGPGWFIAGGAGVTPFIAIFKKLAQLGKLDDNYLIFSNKLEKDVIMHDQWKEWLGDRFISTLTQESKPGHESEKIDEDFLKKHVVDFERNFYVCGPNKMVEDISEQLKNIGADPDGITFEE